jgi:hypothetical protein
MTRNEVDARSNLGNASALRPTADGLQHSEIKGSRGRSANVSHLLLATGMIRIRWKSVLLAVLGIQGLKGL